MNRTARRDRVGELHVAIRIVPTRPATLLPGPTYLGACDASAAVDLDERRFVIASDEPTAAGESALHVYERDQPRPLAALPLAEALGVRNLPDTELDVEAATRVDGRIYWASSHEHEPDGDEVASRRRFFATDLAGGRLRAAGRAYEKLAEDMVAAPELAPLGLERLERERLPSKRGGLNVEGMAARPDGALLLGLRSPRLGRDAVLVPFLNPDAVLEGREGARFEAPIRLDLGGNGIRDLAWDPTRRVYAILGGAAGRGQGRALYAWSGDPGEPPVPIDAPIPADFNAEAVMVDPATGHLRIFSDDGNRELRPRKGKPAPNKTLKDGRRSFRSLWVLLD